MTLLRRWSFLVLGGALFTPFAILALVGLPLATPSVADLSAAQAATLALGFVVVLIALTSLLPIVRTAEAAVVPTLLGGPAQDLVVMPARTRDEQLRGGLWWLLHTMVGAVVSLATVLVPAVSVNLVAGTVTGDPTLSLSSDPYDVPRAWAIPLAIGLGFMLVALAWLCGVAAAWAAPLLLGPNPIVRLAELERQTLELTERARLARELHDSLGHALTVTTLQAGAARRVLRSDPDFAAEALAAIERTGRVAAAELDGVLAMLREDGSTRAPQPTLADVDVLLASHRQAGLPLSSSVADDLDLAPVVSREVYRVLQEALTNVHRHAGDVPTSVVIEVVEGILVLRVCNEQGQRRAGRHGGGHGLEGIRERLRLLGGSIEAGPDHDGYWALEMQVPTGKDRGAS